MGRRLKLKHRNLHAATGKVRLKTQSKITWIRTQILYDSEVRYMGVKFPNTSVYLFYCLLKKNSPSKKQTNQQTDFIWVSKHLFKKPM